MQRAEFVKDQILLGSYSVGYWSRWAYFKVVSFTRSGAPRVVELKKQIISNTSTPVDACTVHKLLEPPEENGHYLYTTRWTKKEQAWTFLFDGDCRVTLQPLEYGKEYHEWSYY